MGGGDGDYQKPFTPITQSHCPVKLFIKTACALSGLPYERGGYQRLKH